MGDFWIKIERQHTKSPSCHKKAEIESKKCDKNV